MLSPLTAAGLRASALTGAASIQANISIERRFHVNENITGYLKNHLTKHRFVCTRFDAIYMLNSNMGMKCYIFVKIFEPIMKKIGFVTPLDIHMNRANVLYTILFQRW